MKKLVIVVLVCIVCSLSQGAVIAGYDFGSNLAATTEGANVTAGVLSLSSGLGGLGGRSGTGGGCVYIRSSGTGITDLAGAITDIDYITFTVDVDAGYQMDLTSLTARQGYTENSGYTGKFAAADLLTSASGFTSDDSVYYNQNFATTPRNGNVIYYDDWDVALSGAEFQGLTGSTEFRFYLTDNTNSADFIHRLDDIVLNGDVSLIPEPATLCLLGLGGLLLRRKK